MKTSLAPGLEGRHRVPRPRRPDRAARGARLQPRRLRLHDLHRQLRPAAGGDLRGGRRRATWRSSRCSSGNRNFEGRINPDVKMNYLASPPLVRRLRARRDDGHRPLRRAARRRTTTASRSTCATSGRPQQEVAETVEEAVQSDMFRKSYGEVFDGDERWNGARGARPATASRGTTTSTYVRRPPFFEGMPAEPEPRRRHRGRARARDARRQRHDRPHLARRLDQARRPGRRATCSEHGVEPRDFNSYGSRRGNHEVMMRGTFANIRLRNQLAPGTEGGVTRHLPDGERDVDLRRRDALQRGGRAAGRARRQGVRLGLVARLGGQGHAACSACAP